MRDTLEGRKEQHTHGIHDFQEDGKLHIGRLKEKLDTDMSLFEQQCTHQQAQLQQEIESRHTAQLKVIESRKESHLKDMLESHKERCADMKKYFDVVERQEEIDIEDLDAEIKRLKKAAIHNKSCSKELEESNEQCGGELRMCSEEAARLELKTKTKDKNTNSFA